MAKKSDSSSSDFSYKVTPRDPRPLRQQLAGIIVEKILDGSLQPNQTIPSTREMSRLSGASLITVSAAYQELEGRGILRIRQGMSTVIAENALQSIGAKKAIDIMAAAIEACRRAGCNDELIQREVIKLLESPSASSSQPKVR